MFITPKIGCAKHKSDFLRTRPLHLISFLAAICLTSLSISGQETAEDPGQLPSALLFVDSTSIIGRWSEGQLFSAPDQISHTLMGNTLYEGNTSQRGSMLYLIGITDPYSRKDQYVYFEDGREIAFSMTRGQLFLGEVRESDLELLLSIQEDIPGYINVFSGLDNVYLGTLAVSNGPLRPAELFACLHYYILHYDLDRQVNTRIERYYPQSGDTSDGGMGSGIMKPYMFEDPYYEWQWDGKTLKPVWGIRAEDEWSYDGKYIRPLFGLVSRQEWVWDGRILKPYWSPEPANQWIWDRNILRRFWNGRAEEEWILEDGILRPHWGADPTRTWIIEGNMPLPLIAMIVLGVSDRNSND